MLSDLAALYAENLPLFAGSVFVLGLVIGSFLNVVIYRLPIMLEREWQLQAAELLSTSGDRAAPTAPAIAQTFNLSNPRSACPGLQNAHQSVAKHSRWSAGCCYAGAARPARARSPRAIQW